MCLSFRVEITMLAVVLYFEWVRRRSGGCVGRSMQLLRRKDALLKVASQE